MKEDLNLTGSDYDRSMIELAQRNVPKIKAGKLPKFLVQDFKDLHIQDEKTLLLGNLPYDQRSIATLSGKEMGDILKAQGNGQAGLLVEESQESLGLRPSKKISLKNGSLKCKFLLYDLYKGTRKSC